MGKNSKSVQMKLKVSSKKDTAWNVVAHTNLKKSVTRKQTPRKLRLEKQPHQNCPHKTR
jgi:hypothetical protein